MWFDLVLDRMLEDYSKYKGSQSGTDGLEQYAGNDNYQDVPHDNPVLYGVNFAQNTGNTLGQTCMDLLHSHHSMDFDLIWFVM